MTDVSYAAREFAVTQLAAIPTLEHRLWICTATEPQRRSLVPSWLRREVDALLQEDGTLPADKVALYTRALVRAPQRLVPVANPTADAETFVWVVRPVDSIATGGKHRV